MENNDRENKQKGVEFDREKYINGIFQKSTFICDFCGKEFSRNEIEIIKEKDEKGKTIYKKICKKCRKRKGLINEKDMLEIIKENLKTPSKIYDIIDKAVIGQKKAKKELAIEIYNHYKRILNNGNKKNWHKNNILMTGPTGTGKTYMIKKISEYLNVPFITYSATTLTGVGYQGKSIQDIILKLIRKSPSPFMFQYGIVFIDEIDKKKTYNDGNKDVSGAVVQQELLTLLEGTNVDVELGRPPFTKTISVDTSNILFIVAGAFEGIENIVKQRINPRSMGFATGNNSTVLSTKDEITNKNLYREKISDIDLINDGLIGELVGRFSVICNLDYLNIKDMIDILNLPDGLINEYKDRFKADDKELNFTDGAINLIAEIAVKKETSARALRFLMHKLLADYLFEAPSSNKKVYSINKTFVKKILKDEIEQYKIEC